MPRSKENVKRAHPDPQAITAAANKVLDNEFTLRQAAIEYNVDRSTLSRHLKKHRESGQEQFVYVASNAVKRVFTDIQEGELNAYLKQCANMHYGLSIPEVRKLAYNYAAANNIQYPDSWEVNQQAGIDWLKFFLKRNTDISLRKPQATSLARSTAFNKANVNLFFDKLKEVMSRYEFGAENIYNLDETGVSTVHTPVRILAPKGNKQIGSVTSGERGANVTIISGINAIGNSVPPLFVFPRVHYKDYMLKGAPVGSVGMAHQSGWSNSNIFFEYLRHLVKHSCSSKTKKNLLILDNHDSHISIESLDYAKENGIIMLTLPPHTSHKLQPLDRTVFGPLKKYYNTACGEWLLSNSGKPMTIYDVAECIGKAYPKAFSAENIQSGFRVSGIYPLNRNIFGDHEFLSSFVTDRPFDPEASPNKTNLPTTSTTIGSEQPSATADLENDLPVPGTSAGTTHLTPESIRPFPKAQARKGSKRGGRKPGRCRILTDTPEKREIEDHAASKKKKTACKKKLTAKRRITAVSSSSSEDNEEFVESDDSLQDVEWGEHEIDEENEESFEHLKNNDFVLVKLTTKKMCKFYVAKIIEVGNDLIGVKYLKKKVGNKFIMEDETIYEIQATDVVMKLPLPHITGGTERRSREMQFFIDFSSYKVE